MTERELLTALLKHPAGYDCGLLGILELRSHCDGFAVGWEEPDGWHEEDFDSLEKAVNAFLVLRNKYQIGIDWETKLFKEEK